MIVHFSIIFVVKSIIEFLFLYNAFNRGNLTNDIVNSNNDNSNSINSNSNNSNSNNSFSNISNSIFSNVCNSIKNNVYVIFNTFSHTLESMCMLILVCVKKCLISFLEVEILIIEQREWKDLFKCQMKSGAYSDTPFLVVTAALLQIDYIYCYLASNGLCSIGSNRNRTTTTTKSVNDEETVRQANRASATNEDHNFIS